MRDLKWKTLSSEYITKNNWATLRKDTCEMPSGVVKDDYYVLEYPNWVNAVAITKENKILIVRQYRHSADIVALEIPGGVIDAGEEPLQAIKRELLEETGYLFEDLKLVSTIYPNTATANNVTYCYLALNGIKLQEQHFDEHEDLIVEEYTIDEVKQMLLNNEISQALHTTGLFYAFLELGVIK